jgi:hypothetical protein
MAVSAIGEQSFTPVPPPRSLRHCSGSVDDSVSETERVRAGCFWENPEFLYANRVILLSSAGGAS